MGVADIIKRNISCSDLDAIIASYNAYPHKDLPDNDAFVYRILRETFIEMNRERNYEIKDAHTHNFLHKKAISKYLDEETHYALERLGHRWDAKSGSFESLSAESYSRVRGKVIDGLVNYAMYFLRLENEDKRRDDNLRLRISLKQWTILDD